jgi:ATP-dependent Clp protease ATP-binding subunit ClpA
LLREDTGIAKRLSRPPLTIEFIRGRIEKLTPRRERIPTSVDMPLSEASKRVLTYAAEEAERRGDKHIGTNHLLLGLINEKDGLAAKVLLEVVNDASTLRDEIGRMSDASWKIAYPQKSKLEDYVEIHGELWSASSVRELSQYYWRFHWEKRRWVPRDALMQRSNQKIQLYTG